MEKVDLHKAFKTIKEYWNPTIATSLNGQLVKLAKIKGEFVWHHHELEDELFLVHKGKIKIEFRDRTITLNAGEMLTIPRGVEHRPIAEEEAEIILFEPASTINTGNIENNFTKINLDNLDHKGK